MSKSRAFVCTLVAAFMSISPASGQTACRARVLEDVRAIQDSSSVMRKGTIWPNVTQFWRNPKTGATWFCAHGDYCYPATVKRAGKAVPAIKLTNCSVRQVVSKMDGELLYGVW